MGRAAWVRPGLAPAGLFASSRMDRRPIEELISKLHPVRAKQPLIRLGPDGDGGYLVPDDLDGLAACFSPGVDMTSGFELDCAERGMKVFMADASVDGPEMEHPQFHFKKKFLGAVESDDVISLDRWVAECVPDPSDDLLLQIDIEGAEYEVLLSTPSETLNRFRVIAAEFHGIDDLWSKSFFQVAKAAIEKLLITHSCVHAHPNNCLRSYRSGGLDLPPLLEFTFVRHELAREGEYVTEFPHPLDRDNLRRRAVPLHESWTRRTTDNPLRNGH